MQSLGSFVSANEIRISAGETSSAVLATEFAETLPVALQLDEGVVILVLFYEVGGPPDDRTIDPPSHGMYLEAISGKVLRFWAAKPREFGIMTPVTPIIDPRWDPNLPVGDFITARRRFLEISPQLWEAFAHKGVADPPLADEYLSLFHTITKPEVVPFYLQASPDFFAWLSLPN